jgi:hypothetical protein
MTPMSEEAIVLPEETIWEARERLRAPQARLQPEVA